MTAAHLPIQRPRQAKLLVVDEWGRFQHWPRSRLVDLFRSGDLVIANDAATLPASLSGEHLQSSRLIEVRLAGRDSLATNEIRHWMAVVFGAGDFRMRTEDRPQPPELATGDNFVLGPLHATVERILGHPRLVRLVFDGSSKEILEGLAHHGRPIQYSHVRPPMALWDVWTPIAGPPVAFESPSASFALDWSTLSSLKERGVRFATITHASGISSTGDPELDALLPFDEPYSIPQSTALLLRDARMRNGESSLLARASYGRSKTQPDSTAPCGQAREWLRSASGAVAACAWWMQCSQELTNPVPAIASCCVLFWMMKHSRGWIGNSISAAIARTNSAIPFSWNGSNILHVTSDGRLWCEITEVGEDGVVSRFVPGEELFAVAISMRRLWCCAFAGT
jgi:S-adenosylmethionine:tRNA-ribosyltransferase-isomerase (queuine synthetase)